jgi:hypothetical protein
MGPSAHPDWTLHTHPDRTLVERRYIRSGPWICATLHISPISKKGVDMARIYVKFFDNEDNVVVLPVTDEDPVPPIGMKPAESYAEARKRNYRAPARRRFYGSVLLSGRS